MKENIAFLYRMLHELKDRGYNVVVVGKAYDDDLYVYVIGDSREGRIDYNSFSIEVFDGFDNFNRFEGMKWYMQYVDEETIIEAINTL